MSKYWYLLIGICLFLILIFAIAIWFTLDERRMHRHQLAHQMAGFLGRAWDWKAVIAVYSGLEIVRIERDPKHPDYRIIFFRLHVPKYGANHWYMAVKYDIKNDAYESFCSLNYATMAEVWVTVQTMRCKSMEVGWYPILVLEKEAPADMAARLLLANNTPILEYNAPPEPPMLWC